MPTVYECNQCELMLTVGQDHVEGAIRLFAVCLNCGVSYIIRTDYNGLSIICTFGEPFHRNLDEEKVFSMRQRCEELLPHTSNELDKFLSRLTCIRCKEKHIVSDLREVEKSDCPNCGYSRLECTGGWDT